MRTLEGLGRRLLTEHPSRSALTVAGVMLGVAMFTGSLLITVTARTGFDEFARDISGQADVIATAPGTSLNTMNNPLGGTIDASVADVLSSQPGVEGAVGLLSVPTAFAGPGGETTQRINRAVAAAIVGVDLDEVRGVFDVAVRSGRLPIRDADELVLPTRVARQLAAGVGDEVEIATREGSRTLTVVGILAERGIGRLDRAGFASLHTVRRITDQPDALTQVALRLDGGIDPREWVRDHEASLPEGVAVSPASASLDFFRTQVNLLSSTVTVVGVGLLFTAGFLVYLTLSMSVVERTRLFGTMLALGATRRQVRRVVVVEALAIGVVGSVPGIGAGVAVALALRAATGRLLELYGNPPLLLSPWMLALGAVVGVTTVVIAALVPARRAARTDAIASIRTTAADDRLRVGSRWIALAIAVAGAMAVLVGGLGLTTVGLVLVLIGVIRLVPHMVGPIARGLGPLVTRLFRSGGRIAVQHLVTERTRSAYTLALVAVVMGMVIVLAAAATSFTTSLERQLTAQLGDDLTVSAASSFPPQFLDALGEVDGVAAITTLTTGTTSYTDGDTRHDAHVIGIDPDTYFDVAGHPFVRGTAGTLLAGLGSGDAIMLPDGTARRLGLELGDFMVLDTRHGPAPFEVAATTEMAGIPSSFVTSHEIAERAFGARGIVEALVRTDPGASPREVRRRIDADLGDQMTFIVSTASEVKADIRAQIGGGINGFYVLALLAGIVGTFGLANTMAVSVTKRYREIGVLRAIGAERRDVRNMAVAEAVTLVAVAFVIAVPLGLALSKPLFDATVEQFGDLTIRYSIPWLIFPLLAAVGLVAAVGAALWPARRAVGIDIDEALRFE